MDRTLQTQFRIEDLRSKDLKRLTVPAQRVYLAHRDNKLYGEEKIYEIGIISKDGTKMFFATEEDLFSKRYYDINQVELLEDKPFVSLMNGTFMAPTSDSDKINMENFETIYTLNYRPIRKYGFRFTDLIKLNKHTMKDQKKYIDRKERNFREQQYYHRHKYKLNLQDDDYVCSQEQ